jgi:lysophospholipase L1-like esterase
VPAILCYGDSNTWGFEASTQERLERGDRWPGVLQRELGDDVHVIEEAQNGRTTVFDVPFEPHRNGLAYLPVSLETHHPLDAVVIDLGTNDLFLPGGQRTGGARGRPSSVRSAQRVGPERVSRRGA